MREGGELKAIIPILRTTIPPVPASMPMLTHNQIWTAIDRLAARAKLTPSGLAKKAGLDPTTFNKSKRVTPEGRPRWPSTESVAKALQATTHQVRHLRHPDHRRRQGDHA